MKHEVALTTLGLLAKEARKGLHMVAQGEDYTMAGWLTYGEALNEGRWQFPSDEQFGQWIVEAGLSQVATHEVTRDDRAAAMWAAEDPKRFRETKRANLRVRTVRGLHAKWKEAGKPAPQPERRAATLDDLRRVEALQALRDDPAASEGERVNAQSKLDAIEKEIGPVEDARPEPSAKQSRELMKETRLKACTIMDKLSPIMTPTVRTGVISALVTAYKDTPEKLDKILAALNT